MDILSVTEIWKWLSWLPNYLLKKIFNKPRLSELVLLDIQPRHNSVVINLGELPSYTLYFQIINMSPFDIELDRAEIELRLNAARIRTQYIKKIAYESGQVATLLIDGEISPEIANVIAKSQHEIDASITVHCEFNCKLHNFSKSNLLLSGVNPKYVNMRYRRQESLSPE